MKLHLTITAILFTFLAVGQKRGYVRHHALDLYSVDAPKDLKSTTVLNDEASMQYMAMSPERYFIVIEEEKESLLSMADLSGMYDYDSDASEAEKYAVIQFDSFKSSITSIRKESKLKKLKLEGDVEGYYRQVDANLEGITEPISYWLAYYAGRHTCYYMLVWCLEADKSKFEKDAHEIIASFREYDDREFVEVSDSNVDSDKSAGSSPMTIERKDKGKGKFATYEIGELYRFAVPVGMELTTELNDDASFQAMSDPVPYEQYVIVIDEDKEFLLNLSDSLGWFDFPAGASDAEKYSIIQFDNFNENTSTILYESGLKELDLKGGLEGFYRRVDAEVSGVPVPITYWLGYIAGKENFYYVMIWSLKEDWKAFDSEAVQMMHSLREL